MAIIKSPSIQLLRALRLAEHHQFTCSLLSRRSNLCRTVCPNTTGPRDRIPFRAQISTTSISRQASPAQSYDRGPVSQEDTQTDFGSLNVLGNTPPPTTSIDACLDDGFHLDNGLKIGGGSGCILLAGEVFSWSPWATYGTKGRAAMINSKGQWEVDKEAWGILDLVWPKPDLLILGLGSSMYLIAPETRKYINSLGIKIEVQDTRNAAAQFNLLATERGVDSIAAALIPIGWKGKA